MQFNVLHKMSVNRPCLRKIVFCQLAAMLGIVGTNLRAQTASSGANDYLINVWSSEDGLPQNSVNCLAQTPDGYLWIGTRSGGLARFDGSRFVVFNPQTTPALKDVELETLSVDSRGTLWITAGNESISSLTGGNFRLVREPNAEPRWHPLQIQMAAEDSNAAYFAAYGNFVNRIPRNGVVNEARRIALNPPPPEPPPGRFSQGPDGAMWYVTGAHTIARMQFVATGEPKINVFDLGIPAELLAKDEAGVIWVAAGDRLGVMTQNGFADHTPTNGPAPHEIREMIPAHRNSLWIWDGNQLRKMSDGRWTLTVPDFQSSLKFEQLRFFADSAGGLWIIEYGEGLWHVHPDGTATRLTLENGLPSKFITCLLEDNEGNIWIGTKEAGLARIRPRQFKEYTTADGIPDNVAQSVCEDAQGTIWVSTATGGLACKKGEKFVPVPLSPNPDPMIESATVCPDAKSGIWVGTLQGRIFRCINDVVHNENFDLTRNVPVERLRDHVANAMMQDSEGRVWFCNGSGAVYFQNGQFTAFDRSRGFVENIGVRAIAEGPPGTLWFGTEPGDVWKFNHGAPTQLHPPKEWPNARVSALLPDEDGSVWVGTLGDGLLYLKNGKFTRITRQQGLPDNSITELLSDGEGNLWGGTYKGIFRARKKDLESFGTDTTNEIALSVFGRFDGLPAQAYSGWFEPSCWRSRDGRLWFTTVKGLVVVNPRDVTVNHRPPPVIIEEMQLDGKPCDFTAGLNDEAHPLSVVAGRHYIEFRFTGINFSEPDKVRFKWRLEGAENDWRESADQRMVAYGPLVPGKYCFRVLAANSDGIWNESGASLAFIVAPFFWETWWFNISMIAVFCGLLALSVTLSLRRQHRVEVERLERRHEVERERTRIARDMHDEIGSKLARISYLSEIAKADLDHTKTEEGPVTSLSKTARELLQSLDRMLWAVNPRNDSLDNLSAYLNRYAAEYFENTPIRCQLSFPENLPAIQLTSETRHNIFLGFQEALANALKYSGASLVAAELICKDGKIRVSVTDNGGGFNVEPMAGESETPAGGRHSGLAGMRHRLQSIGGDCRIKSSPGGGTTITFTIPLNQINGL